MGRALACGGRHSLLTAGDALHSHAHITHSTVKQTAMVHGRLNAVRRELRQGVVLSAAVGGGAVTGITITSNVVFTNTYTFGYRAETWDVYELFRDVEGAISAGIAACGVNGSCRWNRRARREGPPPQQGAGRR